MRMVKHIHINEMPKEVANHVWGWIDFLCLSDISSYSWDDDPKAENYVDASDENEIEGFNECLRLHHKYVNEWLNQNNCVLKEEIWIELL